MIGLLKIIYPDHLVMAQWWHASPHHQFLHQHFASYNALHTMHTLSSIAVRSFLSPTAWEDLFLGLNPEKVLCSAPSSASVSCFCDDDPQIPEHLFDKDGSTFSLRTKLEIRYSPWAMNMMDGFGKLDKRTAKEFTGGPTGGGNGGDDDDGGEGGGGGGDEVWMKHETLDFGFFKTGVGLFFLLAVAAIRLNNQTGLDAYILGLGASVGVMLWTGERYLVQKEGSTGIVTLFAAAMAAIFTAALYKNLL